MPERNDPLGTPLSSTTGTSSTTTRGGSMGTTSGASGSASNFGTTSASETGGTMSNVAEKARDMKNRVVEKATDQAETMFDAQKSRATGTIGSIAHALHQTARTLESENATTAHYVHMVADRVDDFTSTIEGKDLNDLMYDVQTYARRNPAIFFGGALAIGFLAARFMKASSQRGYGRYGSGGYEAGYEEALYGSPSRYGSSRTYGNSGMSSGYGSTTRGFEERPTSDTVTPTAGLTYGEDV